MSKRLNKVTARVEANKTRQQSAHKRNELANNDASSVSSTATDVEQMYLPTTPSESDRPTALLAFYNKDDHWKTPPCGEKRIRKCVFPFKSVGTVPVNQHEDDDNNNKLPTFIGKSVANFLV